MRAKASNKQTFGANATICPGEVSQVQVAGEQAPRNEQGLRAGDLDHDDDDDEKTKGI